MPTAVNDGTFSLTYSLRLYAYPHQVFGRAANSQSISVTLSHKIYTSTC